MSDDLPPGYRFETIDGEPRLVGPKLSRWETFKLNVSFLWAGLMFALFVHDKKTCTAAVCTICKRNVLG